MSDPDAALAETARAELKARADHYPDRVKAGTMSADEAGRGLAAWRAIAQLLDTGQAEPEACLGPSAALAWIEILAVLDAAIDHRARQCSLDGGGPGQRLTDLRRVRTMLIRSAAAQGARLMAEQQEQREAA